MKDESVGMILDQKREVREWNRNEECSIDIF